MSAYTRTPRTRVKRLSKRAVYDKPRVHEILDEGYLCHVGFVRDGQPFVIPTLYARCGEMLYIHGSGVSRMLNTLAEGVQVCVTVTLVDAYVLARSAFHHSMNYRSVVILGRARLLEERQEMLHALETITNQVVPGPPVDDAEDYALPVWAGLVPIRTALAEPLADGRVPPGIAAPHLSRFARPRRR